MWEICRAERQARSAKLRVLFANSVEGIEGSSILMLKQPGGDVRVVIGVFLSKYQLQNKERYCYRMGGKRFLPSTAGLPLCKVQTFCRVLVAAFCRLVPVIATSPGNGA